jgi:hypothetical protein
VGPKKNNHSNLRKKDGVMSKLVNPHGGGELKPLLLEGKALEAEKKKAASLPKVNVSSRFRLPSLRIRPPPTR